MYLGESSFNMTRGGDMKMLRGGSENFETPEMGALKKNLYTSKPTGGGRGVGAPKKLNC